MLFVQYGVAPVCIHGRCYLGIVKHELFCICNDGYNKGQVKTIWNAGKIKFNR